MADERFKSITPSRVTPPELDTSKDINAEAAAAGAQRYNQAVSTRQTRRMYAETARFFDCLEIVEPGVVQLHRWRPDPGTTDLDREVSGYGAIGRKP